MRTTTLATMLITGFLSPSLVAYWQDQPAKDALTNQLQKQYPLTKLSADGKDVVTAGSVFTLKKDGLVLTPADSTDVSGNSYKGGKIAQNATGKANEKANKVKGIFGRIPIPVPGASSTAAAPTNATRIFVAGEKVNITKIEVKDGSVVFQLVSAKAYSDVYFHGSLTFPVDKGTVPAADGMLAITGEVFSVDPPEDTKTASAAPQQGGGSATPPDPAPPAQPTAQPAAENPPPVTKFDDIPPPPPPTPDAAPQPKLALGQTIEQVIAQLGRPVTTAKTSDKEIYLFKDWKVTFVKGKVTDIDVR